MAKKKRAANPTLIMLVQQIDGEFWAHDDDDFADLLAAAHAAAAMPAGDDRVAALREAAAGIAGYICDAWAADGRVVVDCHAVLHSDDARPVWSEASGDYVATPKPLHVHLTAKFESQSKSAPVDRLAELAGVEPQYLEIGRRGGAAVEVCGQRISQSHDNFLAYLTHAKYADKFQYVPGQVATVRGALDYGAVYAERISAWKSARAHIKKRKAAETVEELREMVLTGEVTKSQIMLTDELFDVYARHSREIDDALAAYGQRCAYRAAEKIRRGDFRTAVIFFHGASGSGKTHVAKAFLERAVADAALRGERWRIYRAATSNPLDDWSGEEIIFIDEARSATMDAADWLLLMDPENASPARARYRNKSEVAPRLIVVTCTIEPVEFFFYTRQKGNLDEALDQFIRRLAAIVRVYRVGDDRRYSVGRVDSVPTYTRMIEHENPRLLTRESTAVSLSFGAAEVIEHSHDGVVEALMGEVAAKSPDIDFPAIDGWADRRQLVEIEAADHRRALTDRAIDEVEQAAFAEVEWERDLEAAQDCVAEYVAECEAATREGRHPVIKQLPPADLSPPSSAPGIAFG